MSIEYKKYPINDTMVAFTFKRVDLMNLKKSDEIEALLPEGRKTILMGSRFIQLNGYADKVRHIPIDKETDKLFLIITDEPQQVFASPSE